MNWAGGPSHRADRAALSGGARHASAEGAAGTRSRSNVICEISDYDENYCFTNNGYDVLRVGQKMRLGAKRFDNDRANK
jgi:hypothetical protein